MVFRCPRCQGSVSLNASGLAAHLHAVHFRGGFDRWRCAKPGCFFEALDTLRVASHMAATGHAAERFRLPQRLEEFAQLLGEAQEVNRVTSKSSAQPEGEQKKPRTYHQRRLEAQKLDFVKRSGGGSLAEQSILSEASGVEATETKDGDHVLPSDHPKGDRSSMQLDASPPVSDSFNVQNSESMVAESEGEDEASSDAGSLDVSIEGETSADNASWHGLSIADFLRAEKPLPEAANSFLDKDKGFLGKRSFVGKEVRGTTPAVIEDNEHTSKARPKQRSKKQKRKAAVEAPEKHQTKSKPGQGFTNLNLSKFDKKGAKLWGKIKKPRAPAPRPEQRRMPSSEQHALLWEAFEEDERPDAVVTEALAQRTAMTSQTVRVWFKARRGETSGTRLREGRDAKGSPFPILSCDSCSMRFNYARPFAYHLKKVHSIGPGVVVEGRKYFGGRLALTPKGRLTKAMRRRLWSAFREVEGRLTGEGLEALAGKTGLDRTRIERWFAKQKTKLNKTSSESFADTSLGERFKRAPLDYDKVGDDFLREDSIDGLDNSVLSHFDESDFVGNT